MKAVLGTTQLMVVLFLSFAIFAWEGKEGKNGEREGREPRGKLTEEQKKCLDENLGKPTESTKRDPELARAAFEKCGIKPPERKNDGT
ncbi:hypothetical protein LPTSP3_g03990 [Leptospira kobayashii]|uniref:Lipoprotein n=1 Tax=Leptospira kobayashii TaxID=1917830 RepID=A0ABN6KB34_9LEPT|nr:hypothetical protein [Leptospira kobayashii]BDA77469.1 hypothetical protein LPTSP3_g03990 [Leptospira kobayashii]